MGSRHSGRAYKLVDDDGKTYYRGRHFLRPVQHHQGGATVFWRHTNESGITQANQSTQLRRKPMPMSTFGFIAHALRPLTPVMGHRNAPYPQDSPQTVTRNSYSIFTTKNYSDNEMHWFSMVICACSCLRVGNCADTASAQNHRKRTEETSDRPNGTAGS